MIISSRDSLVSVTLTTFDISKKAGSSLKVVAFVSLGGICEGVASLLSVVLKIEGASTWMLELSRCLLVERGGLVFSCTMDPRLLSRGGALRVTTKEDNSEP